MFDSYRAQLRDELDAIRQAGTFKAERIISSPQGAAIRVPQGDVINFCSNNYLGLADNPEIVAAAREALEERGFGMASVRFICGTQDLHKELERTISRFNDTDDTILYSSCFDANGGLFETILDDHDAIISDQLNHASIIDGVRLCRADRFRYANSDMAELEEILRQTQGHRRRMIATDGVFSMDGYLAKLDEICDLAERYNAMVMVDDSHATGYIGRTGRGTPEHCGVQGRVDVITSTLGKALGGASGGYITGHQEIIDLLRQRSRPYLFSNTLMPALAAAGIKVFEMLSATTALRDRLMDNTRHFRAGLGELGFDLLPGETAIVPVMLYDARLASTFADEMLGEGIYVIGFSYPVVPQGQARIRVQISAAHEREHLDRAVAAFGTVGKRLGVI
ncbi:MAG TPA: glycine C-acetyltransferase [Thermoanaerobaculales bacterium]|nr:glycine C-acetyltransferase [Thermoanaerobaculales bacterium]HPA79950.1 glycine C-acetyltransferase [Thermoanaerobaculales bacterium]HQL29201.1 glycine C-acetyltransferase [Thermoanaerobaculales bacterium]HQN95617.1 glycine C-acetyltransferase [Thermoanaerobaculales bacterium]HQP43920.1 glycine C-acetyltransferase [Thermoanaerobaculales bacterium]